MKILPISTKTKNIVSLAKKLAAQNLTPTFKLCSQGTQILCPNLRRFENTKNQLRQQGLEYYTHDVTASKPLKVVLRSLPPLDLDSVSSYNLMDTSCNHWPSPHEMG